MESHKWFEWTNQFTEQSFNEKTNQNRWRVNNNLENKILFLTIDKNSKTGCLQTVNKQKEKKVKQSHL